MSKYFKKYDTFGHVEEVVKIYEEAGYSKDQLRMIKIGAKKGLNVLLISDSRYNPEQMEQILLGLEEGIDVKKYAKTPIPWEDMEQQRLELSKKDIMEAKYG